MIRQQRAVPGFTSIRFHGPGTLRIRTGSEEALSVDAPAHLQPDIESRVRDGCLHLGYRSPKVVSLLAHRQPLQFDLTVRELCAVSLCGSGLIEIPDLDTDRVSLAVTGSGALNVEQLTADFLDIALSGSGKIRIHGDVEHQSVRLQGSGLYAAAEMVSDFADLHLSGSGSMAITVNEALDAVVTGSGSVTYAGYPDVRKRVSGTGKVLRRRETRQSLKGKEHG